MGRKKNKGKVVVKVVNKPPPVPKKNAQYKLAVARQMGPAQVVVQAGSGKGKKSKRSKRRKGAAIASSHVKRVECLAVALSMPSESPPIRLGIGNGVHKTAVAKTFRKPNVRFNALGGALFGASDLDANTIAAFIFRDPLRNSIISYGLSNTETVAYEAQAEFASADAGIEVFPKYLTPMQSIAPVSPHGKNLYLGSMGPSDFHRGILCSIGQVLQVVIPAEPSRTGNRFIHFKVAEGTHWNIMSQQYVPMATGGTVSVLIPNSGYYCWTTECQTEDGLPAMTYFNATVTVFNNPGTCSMVWGQNAVPDIDDVVESVRTARINSLSLMFTNTSPPAYSQGNVIIRQNERDTSFLDYLDIDEVSQMNDFQKFNNFNGGFIFVKPEDVKAFEFQRMNYSDNTSLVDLAGEDLIFTIPPLNDYGMILASFVNGTGIATPPSGYWTLYNLWEFETQNQIFDTEAARWPQKEFDDAFLLISDIPNMSQNDFHFSDIWDWIKDAASTVWGGIKEVAGVAASAAPFVLPLL